MLHNFSATGYEVYDNDLASLIKAMPELIKVTEVA
jgi:hypothetical protein